jgi:hypothetical protein
MAAEVFRNFFRADFFLIRALSRRVSASVRGRIVSLRPQAEFNQRITLGGISPTRKNPAGGHGRLGFVQKGRRTARLGSLGGPIEELRQYRTPGPESEHDHNVGMLTRLECMCRGCGPQVPNQLSSYRCHLILFRIAVCHDHQVGIRQGPLQRFRVIPRRTHPYVALFVRR